MNKVTEVSDEELEQIEQAWFMDFAAQEWDRKYQEDLEADIFGFYEMDFKMEV